MNIERISFNLTLYSNQDTYIPLYGNNTNFNKLDDDCKYFLSDNAVLNRIIINPQNIINTMNDISLIVGTYNIHTNTIESLNELSLTLSSNEILDFPVDTYINKYNNLIIKMKNLGTQNIKIVGSIVLFFEI